MKHRIGLLSLVGSLALIGTTSALAEPNCTCRFDGKDIPEGQSVCMKSPSGMTMARCEKVLNNTSWKMLDQPCPSANLSPARNKQIQSHKPIDQTFLRFDETPADIRG